MVLKRSHNGGLGATLRVPTLRLRPHMLFFLTYNALYLAPLLMVYIWGFSEGGSEDLVGLKGAIIGRVVAVYGAGILSFYAGTYAHSFLRWSTTGASKRHWQPKQSEIGVTEVSAIFLTVAVFIVSKIMLIPLGVYQTYTLGMMTGGPWSFSAFCSETLILMQILVLFSRLRRRVPLFLALSALNGINLLHGTRVFFIISVMTFAFYLYIQGKLKFKRVVILGPIAFAMVLFAAYAVYLSRMSSSLSGVSVAALVSPLVYESVFSQSSIIGVVSHPSLWMAIGKPHLFVADVVTFTTPRIFIPDKDALLYTSQFNYLSPKGAFNGYADALLYLGYFFPLFYFFIGAATDWLYRLSRQTFWCFALYIYISTDFFLHIMRDGLLIPIKMLINAVQIAILLYIARWFVSLLSWEHFSSEVRDTC
jgi:hypothetical protein